MKLRIGIALGMLLSLGSASCSFVTNFEGWEANQGGSAGQRSTSTGGRNAEQNVGGGTNAAGRSGSSAGASSGIAGTSGATQSAGTSGAGIAGQGNSGAIGVAGSVTVAGGGHTSIGAAPGMTAFAGNGAIGGVAGGSSLGGSAGSSTGGAITVAGANAAGASAAGASAAGSNGCPGTGGPTMVRLPQGYCIDSTEVTREQYAKWLNSTTAETINAQEVTSCGWNTSFVPPENCMSDEGVCQGPCGNHPQVCVDWCDAHAYCKGVGKRLCGKVRGGPVDWGDVVGAGTNQWYGACSSGGVNTYPYGDLYDENACNGDGYQTPNHVATTVAVGTLLGCQAPVPYAGVFDLSGNVWEWEDSCSDTTQNAYCRLRGGGYRNAYPERDLPCDAGAATVSRANHISSFGIRCCSP